MKINIFVTCDCACTCVRAKNPNLALWFSGVSALNALVKLLRYLIC